MATFYVEGRLEQTILVDESDSTIISEQCLCVIFQVGFLHISKDVTYDVNNNILGLVYHVPTTTTQGQQGVVWSRQYIVVNDNVLTHLQETILMLNTTASMVKAMIMNINMKQEIEDIDIETFLHHPCSLICLIHCQEKNCLLSCRTPHCIKPMVLLFPRSQCSLDPHTISPCPSQMFNWQLIAFAQCHSHNILLMSCIIWTMTKLLFMMFFLSTTFNSDILFQTCPPYPIIITLCHRCKAWIETMMNMLQSKVITTNIKNSFGLNFREVHYLGHLCCVQDDCDYFIRSRAHNETIWIDELTHTLSKGKLSLVLLLPHLDANVVIPSHFVLTITKFEFITLSIDSNPFKSLVCIYTLSQMVSVDRLWKRLKC